MPRSPSYGPAGPGCTSTAAGPSGGCGSSGGHNARPEGRGVVSGGAAGGSSIPRLAQRWLRLESGGDYATRRVHIAAVASNSPNGECRNDRLAGELRLRDT
jgi:hypothetical protein